MQYARSSTAMPFDGIVRVRRGDACVALYQHARCGERARHASPLQIGISTALAPSAGGAHRSIPIADAPRAEHKD
jgi:hypothetical protein